MTPKEMHIGMDLQLQKVHSGVVSSLKPEQKDWLLNDEVIRFIKQRTSPISNDKRLGLQNNQKRFDDIRNLITPATLPVYTNDADSVFAWLPANYFSLVSDRSLTKDLCGVSYSTVATSTDTYYICNIPIADDVSLYTTFNVKLNGTTVFDLSSYVTGGLPVTSMKFVIVNYMLQRFGELSAFLGGLSAKYENYFGVYVAGSIILVAKQAFTATITYATGSPVVSTALGFSFNKVNTVSGALEVGNRLTRTEDLRDILDLNFGSTVVQSPLSTLEEGKLIAYHKQKFILSGLNISYIRKPKKIDLSLNQGCELAESVHDEIVDNAVKRLAGLIGSQQYNQIINENSLKE